MGEVRGKERRVIILLRKKLERVVSWKECFRKRTAPDNCRFSRMNTEIILWDFFVDVIW